jgi:hypothetical protein
MKTKCCPKPEETGPCQRPFSVTDSCLAKLSPNMLVILVGATATMSALDVSQAVMVGHSTGGGEVARYMGRHGTSRIAAFADLSDRAPEICALALYVLTSTIAVKLWGIFLRLISPFSG